MKMKKLFIFVCLLVVILCLNLSSLAFAELYYCVPNNDKYVCEPAGEIREYPNGKTSASTLNGFVDKFRCHMENSKWICIPFDKGAIILEPEHKCSESTLQWYRNNLNNL